MYDDERERKQLLPLIIPLLRASHTRLVEGIYTTNPHSRVLCPRLSRNNSCKRKEGNKKGKGIPVAKPKFLIRNFNDPSLELWQCSGCKDFLLRVEV